MDTPISPGAGSISATGNNATNTPGTVTSRVPGAGSLTFAGAAGSLQQCVGPTFTIEEQYVGGVVIWAGIGNGVAGAAGPQFRYKAVCVQVSGTFGSGGSIKLQGSNDGITWNDLAPAALTGAGFFAALGTSAPPKWVRPSCTAGDSTTNLTAIAWFS